jgi:Tol biopolymer transport system component
MNDTSKPSNPPTSQGFEWLMALLAVLLIGGLNLDIWAHSHGRVDQSFFTPWHAVLYGAMAINGIALGIVMARNVLQRGYPWRRALPEGYGLSLVGVIAFAIGGGLDLWWHTVFGIEASTEALLSPTHLILATSAALILTGPLRSAALRVGPDAQPGWSKLGPMVLSVAAVFTLLGFFTQYAHPLYTLFGEKSNTAPVHGSIFVTRLDGSGETRLTVDPSDDDWGASVSPDHTRIAYRKSDPKSGVSDLYVAAADGSHAARITHSGRHDTQPAWSPDGRFIAYVSSPASTSGNSLLQVVPEIGGQPRTLTNGTATLNGPSWSPDGDTIAFGSRKAERDWVAVIPAAGGTPTFLTAGVDGSWPAWSPNGATIAFTLGFGTGSAAIYSMDARGVEAARISPRADVDDRYPAWSPDGRSIAYTSYATAVPQVFVMRADGSQGVDATRNPGVDAERPSWAGDGQLVFSGVPNPLNDDTQNQGFGVGSFLLQTVLTMGFMLLVICRFRVPIGALTVILMFDAVAMVIVSDNYFLLTSVLITGVAADAAVFVLGERTRHGGPFYALAFGVGFLLSALYEAIVAKHAGLAYPPNIVLGIPFLTGVAGLLVAYAFRPPLSRGPKPT